MAVDDLRTPLKAPQPRRRLPDLVRPLAIVAVLVVAGAVGWGVFASDPLGGEPQAVAAIDRTLPPAAAPSSPPDAAAKPALAARGPDGAAAPPSGPLVIRIGPGGAIGTGSRGALAPKLPDEALLEDSRHGALPRIAEDGRRPSEVYARSVAAGAGDRPRIALFVGGLGIGDAVTGEAMKRLPPDVTLGFVPYGGNLERWVETARRKGHEVILQVPMEPFDYPNNDPGPQSLLTTLPAPVNLERLRWVMGRTRGYVGLANFMGAKFAATEEALVPVLTEIGRRGLLFLDDGAAPRSLIEQLGPDLGAPVARAEPAIDASPQPADIDAALARLEDLARRRGGVIGTAGALPVSLARIEHWAKGLGARGVQLVPVSALVQRRAPT